MLIINLDLYVLSGQRTFSYYYQITPGCKPFLGLPDLDDCLNGSN